MRSRLLCHKVVDCKVLHILSMHQWLVRTANWAIAMLHNSNIPCM